MNGASIVGMTVATSGAGVMTIVPDCRVSSD